MQHDLERLQSLTKNYNFLQGSPIALVGLMYLILGFFIMLWGRGAIDLIYGWLFLPSMGVLAIGVLLAGFYQQKKFGTVKISLPRRTQIGLAVFSVLYFVLIRLSGPDFKYLFKAPLEPSTLNGGIMLILAGLLPGLPWRHYVVFGVLLMGAAFLPAILGVPLQQFYDHGWSFIMPGIAFALCGMIDRLILARNLAALRVRENHV